MEQFALASYAPRVAYNGFGLGEGGDFHYKCLCGEPMFD